MGTAPPPGDLTALNASFARALRAQNKSERTVQAYTDAVRLLAGFCHANGLPTTASAIERAHLERFITDQLARWKPATANNRYAKATAEERARAAHARLGLGDRI